MQLEQEFTLDRPLADVWSFFKNVPAVADCLPGAVYQGTNDDGSHTGKMSAKVGPFQASFEGAATAIYDDAAHTVAMSGKGVDKRGASRGKMTMDCALTEHGQGTLVRINADVQLSGSIAQFGRTGIIEEIAKVLIADFVANVEAAIPAAAAQPSGAAPQQAASEDVAAVAQPAPARRTARKAPIGGTRLLWIAIKSWFRSRFGSQS